MGVQVSLKGQAFKSFGYILRSVIAESYANTNSNFLRIMGAPFYIPTNSA